MSLPDSWPLYARQARRIAGMSKPLWVKNLRSSLAIADVSTDRGISPSAMNRYVGMRHSPVAHAVSTARANIVSVNGGSTMFRSAH